MKLHPPKISKQCKIMVGYRGSIWMSVFRRQSRSGNKQLVCVSDVLKLIHENPPTDRWTNKLDVLTIAFGKFFQTVSYGGRGYKFTEEKKTKRQRRQTHKAEVHLSTLGEKVDRFNRFFFFGWFGAPSGQAQFSFTSFGAFLTCCVTCL